MSTDDDMVVLASGPYFEGGRLVRRAELPKEAYQSTVTVPGEGIEGGDADATYEVWSVD